VAGSRWRVRGGGFEVAGHCSARRPCSAGQHPGHRDRDIRTLGAELRHLGDQVRTGAVRGDQFVMLATPNATATDSGATDGLRVHRPVPHSTRYHYALGRRGGPNADVEVELVLARAIVEALPLVDLPPTGRHGFRIGIHEQHERLAVLKSTQDTFPSEPLPPELPTLLAAPDGGWQLRLALGRLVGDAG